MKIVFSLAILQSLLQLTLVDEHTLFCSTPMTLDQLRRLSERSVHITVSLDHSSSTCVCRRFAEHKNGCAAFCNFLNKPVENQRLLYFSHILLHDKRKLVLQYCRIHDEKFYFNSCLPARTSLLVLVAIFRKMTIAVLAYILIRNIGNAVRRSEA